MQATLSGKGNHKRTRTILNTVLCANSRKPSSRKCESYGVIQTFLFRLMATIISCIVDILLQQLYPRASGKIEAKSQVNQTLSQW